MRIYLFTLSLSLLLLTIQGCRHGTTDTSRIHAVSPTGVAGAPGAIIEFSIDFDATGTATFAWNFDHGAEPATSTAESPTVTLQDPGTYDAYVELRVDDTLVQHFDFEFTVASPPAITAVTPEGDAGLVRGIVRFEAVFEGDFDALEWEFGDGATVREQDEQAVEVRLRDPGTYTGAVRSVYGTASSDDFPFEYTVTAPVAPTWTTQDVAMANINPTHSGTSMTLHLGRIAIAFTAPDGLRLALAKNTMPCCPADWDTHLIDPIGQMRSSQALISQDDRLIVAYLYTDPLSEETPTLRVAVAQVAEPKSDEDWVIMTMGSSDDNAGLLARDVLPPVLITDSHPRGLNFCAADVNLPESEEDWISHSIVPESLPGFIAPQYPFISRLGTGYQVVYSTFDDFGTRRVSFAQTSVQEPESPNDWLDHVAEPTGVGESFPFIGLSDDAKPALLFSGLNLQNLRDRNLVILKSHLDSPSSIADWDRIQLPILLPTGGHGFGSAVGERALFIAPDNEAESLLLLRQVGSEWTSALAWEETGIDSVQVTGPVVLLDLGNRLAIAVQDLNNGQLRLFLSSGSY